MLESRLNYLSIMCIESDLLKKLQFDDLIDDFGSKKSRKNCFKELKFNNLKKYYSSFI